MTAREILEKMKSYNPTKYITTEQALDELRSMVLEKKYPKTGDWRTQNYDTTKLDIYCDGYNQALDEVAEMFK